MGESINALDVVFGDASASINGLGEDAARNVGLSNLDFNNLSVQFAGFAKTIVGEEGDVVNAIDEMTTRAADFASVYNTDVAEAAGIFQSTLAGEMEPIKRFGITLSSATVDAYAYANGIANVGEELTEAEKVQARYGLLMQETEQTAGDFANTSDSLANSQRSLSAEWENMQAELGERLLPVMTNVTGWLLDEGLPAVQGFIDDLGDPTTTLGGIVQGVQDVWGELTNPPEGGAIDLFTDQYEADARELADSVTENGGLLDSFGDLGVAASEFTQAITGTDGTAEALGTLANWSLKPLEFQLNNLKWGVDRITDAVDIATGAWQGLTDGNAWENWKSGAEGILDKYWPGGTVRTRKAEEARNAAYSDAHLANVQPVRPGDFGVIPPVQAPDIAAPFARTQAPTVTNNFYGDIDARSNDEIVSMANKRMRENAWSGGRTTNSIR